MTTSPMTWVACLEWMLARGYRELMWPCWKIMGTASATRTESLERALQLGEYQCTRGRRYFIDEAPSVRGEVCAWVYELPTDLDPADLIAERREIEKLLDGPQWIEEPASESASYAYEAAGVGRVDG